VSTSGLQAATGSAKKAPSWSSTPRRSFTSGQPENAQEIFQETVLGGKVLEALLYEHPTTKQKIVQEDQVPFYQKQTRIIFGNNGSIDPTRIEDYLAVGGYRALCKALFSMKPEEVIREVKEAKLRGRGAEDFPPGSNGKAAGTRPTR